MDKAIVTVSIDGTDIEKDLEIPIDISVKEICVAIKKALDIERKDINISGYYIKTEYPTRFLKGNDILKRFDICDGTKIILI
jgi:uncharacterized ubiquitin-like protein YukD